MRKLLLLGLLLLATPCRAQIALVNTAAAAPVGFGNSISSAPQNHAQGNLLVVEIYLGDSPVTVLSVTDTAGNLFTRVPSASQAGAGLGRMETWFAASIRGNPSNIATATLSADSGARRLSVLQYSGADPTNPFDQGACASGTANALPATLASPLVTTTAANEALIGNYGANQGGDVPAALSPWTLRTVPGTSPGSPGLNATEDQIVNSTGAFQAIFNVSGAATPLNWGACISAFKSAPRVSIATALDKFSKIGLACRLTSCECIWPNIKQVQAFPAPATPGGYLRITGCGFGSSDDPNDQFSLDLHLVDYTGSKKPPVQLEILFRIDTVVGAKIPYDYDINGNDVMGVKDQTAFLQASRRTPQFWHRGPLWPLGIYARRDIAWLPGNDPKVRILVPGSFRDMHGDFGGCQAGNPTFGCKWYNSWGLGPDNSGWDVHEILPLDNDWVFHSLDFRKSIIIDELEVRDPDPPFPACPSPYSPACPNSWRFGILWWVTPNDVAWYAGKVYIVGPTGVPW